MATIQGFTKDRMLQIENASVTGGSIDSSGDLILQKKDGTTINAGQARGNDGLPGEPGPPGPPAPDSGYVDLSILVDSGATGWQLNSFIGRKVGGMTTVDGSLTYLSPNPNITAGSDANIPDITNWLILPAGWQNSGSLGIMVPIIQSGLATWFGRLNTGSGAVDLTHGSYPGQILKAGSQLYVHLVYWST